MSKLNRRNFLSLTSGALAATSLGFPMLSLAGTKRVVIVGGGIGGATAAKYIRMADSSINVTLIEPNKNYYTCFMSNEVLGGGRDLDSIKFGYAGLKKHGVDVVHDLVTGIDPVARKVSIKSGSSMSYDACIVSPGVDFRWEAIEGHSEAVIDKVPHAWKAGPQTAILKKQIMAMRDGGTVAIVAPPNPFRCPPGPYERASQIAWYLKNHKPKSKIIILDNKPKFSKMGLFTAGWEKYYGFNSSNSMIEWVSGDAGGKVASLDVAKMSLSTDAADFKADVINIIPAQKAGKIAFTAGLVNEGGWCPVNQRTFESSNHKDIYVIGDSSVAAPLPKSGYSANSEAKVCAAAIVAKLNGKDSPEPSLVNTCYSIIMPDDAISVAMVYRMGKDGKIMKIEGSGGLTPADSSAAMRKREVGYAHSWFNNITDDIFG
ncbi:MAG: NAD(P)/FAD-dependent oxidoreductase [Gammaproteobacteria bacterium]|nr:NAD(P)/FAD-dependent oxidoreductase [Gammaproteobacteria bacterium]